MFENVIKLGISGGLGLLVGVAVVLLVGPTTTGGTGFDQLLW